MLTQELVARAAVEAGLPTDASYIDVTGSTNTDLMEAARNGAPEWTVLVAGKQEGGRGRLGRGWSSPAGKSLSVSTLMRPSIPPHAAPTVSLAAAVAMSHACLAGAGVQVRCKWPNDLVVGDRKLGGILAEASVAGGTVDHVVVGCGLNVGQRSRDFPPDIRPSATSLTMESGRPDPFILLREYLARLRSLYGDGGHGLAERVRRPYAALCETLGRDVRAVTVSGLQVLGVAEEIGLLGELILSDPAGRRHTVRFGEVERVR